MDDFSQIYQQFHPRVLRYLSGVLGAQEAEDVVQGVMLSIAHALPGFRGDSSLSTWIYRIATNAARDHLRRQRSLPGMTEHHELCSEVDLSHAHIRDEMGACIRSLIDQLPQSYRMVLLLSDYEECSNPEIAAILDLSLDTVKIRLHLARARLRQLMECECELYHHGETGLMCDRRQK